MIPVYQDRFGGPGEHYREAGNCVCACLASIFEIPLEETPNVSEAGEGQNIIHDWLESLGWGELYLTLNGSFDAPGYYLASVSSWKYGLSEDGHGLHSVVASDGKVVHNPNPYDSRPLDELEITDAHILYPLDPARPPISKETT